MLPFEPETIESARARLPAAFAVVYDLRKYEMFGRSTLTRDNVFDLEDGLRCVISVENLPLRSEPFLHISCSAAPESEMGCLSDIYAILDRIAAAPARFWPDTLIVVQKRYVTEQGAFHLLCDIPLGWAGYFKAETVPAQSS